MYRRCMFVRACSVVVALLLAAAPAAAFRPSSRWLIEQAMVRQIDRAVRTLKIEAQATPTDANGNAARPVVERLYLLAPGSLRKEVEQEDGVRVEIRAGDKVTTKAPGQNDKTAKAGTDVVVDWLATGAPLDKDQAADRVVADLKAMNVNVDVVSFARFDGRVAYLIGGKPWETDKPSIWIDKETLLLVRVIAVGKDKDGNPATTDVRLLGYGSPEGGNWFPKSIETWVNGKLARRSVTRSVDKNTPLEAGLFDPKK